MIDITSVKNEKIKEVANLLEKSKARRTQGLFVVEGLRELANCVKAGYKIEGIYTNPDITNIEDITAILDTAPNDSSYYPRIFTVTKDVYEKIAYRDGTEGVVAVVQEKRLELDDIKLGLVSGGFKTTKLRHPLILVVESVEKPGNLGALLRTADACGVDAVLVCDPLTDLYNPNLIRASLGGIFTQQVIACTSEEAYKWLSGNKIAIFTAQLQDSEWYYNSNMVQPCAIVMGSEANGLSDFWREVANTKIKIPMLGELDSLNVSVSAAVLCYEAVRQRTLASK